MTNISIMIKCHFENNDEALLRHITIGTIVLKDNQVLLGKRGTFRGKKIIEAGKWSLLSGFMQRDETLIEAARREVMEESGWEIDNVRLMKINDNPNRPKEDRQNVDFIYVADAIKQTGKNDEETKELKWFELSNLPADDEIAFDHAENLKYYRDVWSKQ